MIGARLFGALLVRSALVAARTVNGKERHFWTSGSNRFGFNGAQHSEYRIARAIEKRGMRRAKVNANVRAGGYGLTPFVGQKGYTPNTSCGVKSLQARGLVSQVNG